MDSEPKLWLPKRPSVRRLVNMTYELHEIVTATIEGMVKNELVLDTIHDLDARHLELQLVMHTKPPVKLPPDPDQTDSYQPTVHYPPPDFGIRIWYAPKHHRYQTDDVYLQSEIGLSQGASAEAVSQLQWAYRKTVADYLLRLFMIQRPEIDCLIRYDEENEDPDAGEEERQDMLFLDEDLADADDRAFIQKLMDVRSEIIAGVFGTNPGLSLGNDLLKRKFDNECVERGLKLPTKRKRKRGK